MIGLVPTGDAALAYAERQRRVNQALDLQEMRDRHGPLDVFGQGRSLRFECKALGVGEDTLEILLCNTLVRYEFLPWRIKIMHEARPDNARAKRYLQFIDGVLNRANVTAQKSTALFNVMDPTGVSDEVFAALAVMVGHFESAAVAERELRRKLGLSLQRLRAARTIAQRVAIGYFSAAMMQQFSDGRPHDQLVADLVNAALLVSVTYADMENYRRAFLTLREPNPR